MSEFTHRERSLRDYLRVLARRKLVVLVAVVATVGAALGLSALQNPVYEAEAQMLVNTRPTETVFNDGTQSVGDPVRAVATEMKILESQPVAERVRANLGLSSPPPDVIGTVVDATDVVNVTVRSGDPTTARIVADAYVQAYIQIKQEGVVDSLRSASSELEKKVLELQGEIDALDKQVTAVPAAQQATTQGDLASQRRSLVDQQTVFKQRLDQLQVNAALATGSAQVVRHAAQPSSPVEPRPTRTAAMAAVVGLLIGLGGALAIDHFDDSIRTEEDVERAVGLPVLAMVPVDPPPDARPIAISRGGDFAVETYKNLRASLQFLGLDFTLKVIQVTSPVSGEGKTTTASNLAVVFAAAGHRVILIDADLRKPRVHEVFSLPQSEGLTSVLLGEPYQPLVHTPVANLDVLTSGPQPPNPSEVVGGRQMRALVETLAADYDYVIVDSAPVLPVSDSVGLASLCDGVLLVAQAAKTSKRQASDSANLLARSQTPLLGVVLNRVESRSRPGSDYGYGTGTYGSSLPNEKPLKVGRRGTSRR